jgi:predicted DNA-binding ribbon-helix-helix protein
MSAITLRLPDAKYDRLKALAKSQKISVNKLLDELITIALVSYDAKYTF